MVMRLGHISRRAEALYLHYVSDSIRFHNKRRWDAYNHLYWPARCLTDAGGFVRYQHCGEARYRPASTVVLISRAANAFSTAFLPKSFAA